MARSKIPRSTGLDAVRRASAGTVVAPGSPLAGIDRETVATAVRFLLQVLAEDAPGNTVEVRIPPFGAVQCVEGPTHTRGTPPNVVETDAATWLSLATGRVSWAEAIATGRVAASGQRADLSALLPVVSEVAHTVHPGDSTS